MKLIPIEGHCILSDDVCRANVVSALARGLRVCGWAPKRTGRIAIVGSGPSVLNYLDELRSWPGELWAVNGAYRFLIEQGFHVHGFVGLDPVPGLKEYVEKRDDRTTFFISSVCDPSVFDELTTAPDVWLWHSKNQAMPHPKDACVVGGGTTCLTRAPFLAHMVGWRDITVYGGDSSFNERTYCYDHSFAEDTKQGRFEVEVGDRVFVTELSMLKQAPAFGVMQQMFNGLLKFRCEGTLLDAYLNSPIYEIKNAA